MPIRIQRGFSVQLCSLCNEWRLTWGESHRGGVRYCQECIKHTLGWVQFSGEDRQLLIDGFTKLMTHDEVKAQLSWADRITDDERKRLSVHEASLRLLDANDRESGGRGVFQDKRGGR